jgi:hypothetical protein
MTDTPRRRANYSKKLERCREGAQAEQAKTKTLTVVPADGGLAVELADTRSQIARQLEREQRRPVGDPMPEDEARRLTERIKRDVETVWRLIEEAYLGRAWIALGYESWDIYCIREFGASRLRIPREERPEMVTSLRQAGLSIRAIASATGSSTTTVQADLQHQEVCQSDTPSPERDERIRAMDEAGASVIEIADELGCELATVTDALGFPCYNFDDPDDMEAFAESVRQDAPTPIIGTDGKTYPRPKPDRVIREEHPDEAVSDFLGTVVNFRAMKRNALAILEKAVNIRGFEEQKQREIIINHVDGLRTILSAIVEAAQGVSMDEELQRIMEEDQ